VGILFFVLAACYFVKLTIDAGWLTPQRQFAGIVLFGIGLVATGLKLHNLERSFAAMISGAGVVVFFVAVISGHLHFELYNTITATLVTALVSAVSVALFRVFQHDFFLISAACGSYFLPIILGPRSVGIYGPTSYFVFWDAVYVAFAIILNRRLLIALTSYLAIGCYYLLWVDSIRDDRLLTESYVFYFQLFQFLLLTTGVLAFSVRNKVALTAIEAWSFFPILLLFYAAEYGIVDRIYSGQAPYIGLAFAAAICGFYFVGVQTLKSRTLASGPVVSAFTSLVLFHTLYLELLPRVWCPWLALGLLLLPLAFPNTVTGSRHWVAMIFPKMVVAAEYMRIMFDDKLPWMNLMFMGGLLLYTLLQNSVLRSSFIVLTLAIAQGMRGIYLLVDENVAAPMNQLVTSGCWAGLAMFVLLLGYSRRDEKTAKAGVMLFGFIAGKVLLNDLETTDSVVRVISLVVIGALLYAGGIVWKRVDSFK
jgi:uncharacterized membrane protein